MIVMLRSAKKSRQQATKKENAGQVHHDSISHIKKSFYANCNNNITFIIIVLIHSHALAFNYIANKKRERELISFMKFTHSEKLDCTSASADFLHVIELNLINGTSIH